MTGLKRHTVALTSVGVGSLLIAYKLVPNMFENMLFTCYYGHNHDCKHWCKHGCKHVHMVVRMGVNKDANMCLAFVYVMVFGIIWDFMEKI